MRLRPRRPVFRLAAACVLAGFLPLASLTGCFGSFQLTRKVYDFNRTVSPDKWIRWLMFLGMNVLPIYGFSLLIDAFFANSVEFWSGSNPITAQTREVTGPSGEVARATRFPSGLVKLEVIEPDGTAHRIWLAPQGDSLVARDADGTVLARVGDVDGRPAFLPAPVR